MPRGSGILERTATATQFFCASPMHNLVDCVESNRAGPSDCEIPTLELST